MGFRRTGHDVKSVGNEQTFLQYIVSLDIAQKELLVLGDKVARRMRHKLLKGKTVTLNTALDLLYKKFGDKSVVPGTLLKD